MSRNGCDQIKSSVAFKIAARVRSDLPTLDTGCGLMRGRDDDLISDIVLYYTDTVSAYNTNWYQNEARTAIYAWQILRCSRSSIIESRFGRTGDARLTGAYWWHFLR